MTLGIIEPNVETQPPGTYLLVDTSHTSGGLPYEHSDFKHGKGKVYMSGQLSLHYRCS